MISVADCSEQEVGLGKPQGLFQLEFLIILWSSLGVMMSLCGQTRAPGGGTKNSAYGSEAALRKWASLKQTCLLKKHHAVSSRIHKPVLCPFGQWVPTAPTPWCSQVLSRYISAHSCSAFRTSSYPSPCTQILWSVPDLLTVVSPVYAIFLMSFHLLFLARVLQYLTNLSFFP